MSEIDSEPFPIRALTSAGLLVGVTLALTSAVSFGLVKKPANAAQLRAEHHTAAKSSRTLVFADHPTGVLIISDVGQHKLVRVIMPGEKSGFIRGVLRSFTRERRANHISAETAFRLTLWADDSLSLTDLGTGRNIELGGFGRDNRAAFAALLEPETPQKIAAR